MSDNGVLTLYRFIIDFELSKSIEKKL